MNKNLKYIENLIMRAVESNEISGANVYALKDGKEIYKNSVGFADLENKIPMKENTIFRIYSMSKIVTSVAIMILFERGLIDLYNPVSKYLDGFKNQKVAHGDTLIDVEREVTIRDLLNMTSGVCYPGTESIAHKKMNDLYNKVDKDIKNHGTINTIEFCNEMGKVPLAFQPGEKWMYGASADVLGAIVEVVSNKKFGQFLKDEIFTPLEMDDTSFYITDDKKDRLAKVYKDDKINNRLELFLDTNLCVGTYNKELQFESGGAGLLSTIDDYSNLATMLLNKGKYKDKQILSRKTVEFMAQNGLNKKQLDSLNWEYLKGYGYGNLLRVLMNNSEASTNASVGEYGWDGWLGTYVSIDPKENLIFLYFIQKHDTGTTELGRRIKNIVYSSIE